MKQGHSEQILNSLSRKRSERFMQGLRYWYRISKFTPTYRSVQKMAGPIGIFEKLKNSNF